MEKFHIQFIVGTFSINHVEEAETADELKEKYFTRFRDKKRDNELWTIEDSILDPALIAVIRISSYVEPKDAPPTA